MYTHIDLPSQIRVSMCIQSERRVHTLNHAHPYPPTLPPCNIEPYVHARAVAQNTVIGVLCCARTWLSRVLTTPWQMIISDWRSSVSDATNGKQLNFYFRGWMDIFGSRTILTASPWKIICGGIQKKSGHIKRREGSIIKRRFRSSHPKGSLSVCMPSWRES